MKLGIIINLDILYSHILKAWWPDNDSKYPDDGRANYATYNICMALVPISGLIGKPVMQIASATGTGYRHTRSMRFSNKQLA